MDFLEKNLKIFELLTKAAKDDVSEVASIAVCDGDSILMGKRRDNGRWTMPGGHLDKGEEKNEGAVRELFEEAGIKVGAKDLKYMGSKDVTTFTGKKKKIHAFKYHWEGERPTTKNDPDKEVGEWEWIDCKDGIPSKVADNSHTPVDKNCVFSFLGLKPEEKVEKADKKVYSVDEVVNHFKACDTPGPHQERCERYIRKYPQYMLTTIDPADTNHEYIDSSEPQSQSMIGDYSSRQTEPPAIIVHPDSSGDFSNNNWQIIDGVHRTKAAVKNNKSRITAFVPVAKSEFEIYKSNYGPKYMKLYDPKANERRKANRPGDIVEGAGPNAAGARPSVLSTSKDQAKRIAMAARKKSKMNPVKIYNKEEIAQMQVPPAPKKLVASELAKAVDSRAVARHWHDTAYPGDRYDNGQREYFEDMLNRHHEGGWDLVQLPIAQLHGHHQGHDASKEYVEDYAKMGAEGSPFPPLIAEPHPKKAGDWITIDGQHRLQAAQRLGHKTIEAYVPSASKVAKSDFFDQGQDWQQSYLQNPINNEPDSSPEHYLKKPENYDHHDIPSYVIGNLLASGYLMRHPKRGIIRNRKIINRGDHAPLMRSEEGPLELVHYSPVSGLSTVDPNKMGSSGVRSGGQYKYGLPETKTSFHYIKGTEPEDVVTSGAKSKYKSFVHPQHLYDLHQDPKGLVNQAVQENQGAWNTDLIFKKIKDSGYKGIWAPNADHPVIRGTVQLFHPHPVEREEIL